MILRYSGWEWIKELRAGTPGPDQHTNDLSNHLPYYLRAHVLLAPAFCGRLAALAIRAYPSFPARRFKRIDFPNVRFLRRSPNKHAPVKVPTLVGIAGKLLAIGALVLAFAQPYIPSANQKTWWLGNAPYRFNVDDSYSMDGQNAQGRLLDQARKGAQDAVMA